MSWIVGCDTGGTFTDVFAVSDSGDTRVAKVPSTPPHFDVAVAEGVRALGIPPTEVETVFHGTTVTTNAVITKTGAPSALVTTLGFRDVLEIRRANREELYDILWDPPPPLIPRRHRLEVDERVNYAGEVIRPLSLESVRAVARKIKARGLESVAVCLINAHMNPAHEREVREHAARGDPGSPRLPVDRHPPGAARVRADGDDGGERVLRADPAALHGQPGTAARRQRDIAATSSSSCTTAAAP